MAPQVPPPPDYMGLANQQAQQGQQALNQQTAANRPNQSNPWASSTWTQGPGGQWSQSTQFTGPMADLNASLMQQAQQAMSSPFSLGGLPGLTSGEQAREQAINAAYGSATSRLDPRFQAREQEMRTQLLNQGLQEGSAAYDTAMRNLGMERNDAYNQAMSSAIGQGTQAGSALFNQSMAQRQQALAEALRQRGQAMSEIQGMQGLTGQQGFAQAGLAPTANLLGAAGMQDAANLGRVQLDQQFISDLWNSIGQLGSIGGSALGFALSDERAKQDVRHLGQEVVPGVPLVSFSYRQEHGDPSVRYVGVLAQDVARAAPQYVQARGDGMLMVRAPFHPLEVYRG